MFNNYQVLIVFILRHSSRRVKLFTFIKCVLMPCRKSKSHQVVVWPNSKQLSEVAEGNRGIGFKSKVWEMVGWCEVAAFAVWDKGNRHIR